MLVLAGCVSLTNPPPPQPEETVVLAAGAIAGTLAGVAGSLRFQNEELKSLRRTCKADFCIYPAFSESADPNKNLRIKVKLDKEALRDMVDGMESAHKQKRIVSIKKRFGHYLCNENYCKAKVGL